MTPILSCPKCGNPTTQRSRVELADRIHEVVLMCARTPEDWARRFQMLTANMMWLESELRGHCQSCTVEEAAIEVGALRVEIQRIALPVDQPPETKRHLCIVYPIDEMRGRRAAEQTGGAA